MKTEQKTYKLKITVERGVERKLKKHYNNIITHLASVYLEYIRKI